MIFSILRRVLVTSILPKEHTFRRGIHSLHAVVRNKALKVHIIPALTDNFMYILVDEATKECTAVDPVNVKLIIETVSAENLSLKRVLTTHHHWDHDSGNLPLAQHFGKGLEIVGGDDRIKGMTRKVSDGEEINIGSLKVKCLSTPCHTLGHFSYFVTDANAEYPLVFTGDTLFTGGCGMFFEGNAEMMYQNLIEIFGKLPKNTKVFCGHEYTEQNLHYAIHVEPNNELIQARKLWAENQRNKSLPTVPSTIEEELNTNPFMRVSEPAVLKHAGTTDPIECMKFLREEKTRFKVVLQ